MIGRTILLVFALGIQFAAVPTARAEGPAKFMMATQVDGKKLEGQPLVWDQRQMFLLGRDGALYDFAPKKAENSRKIGRGFRGYSIGEMRQRLREEFDRSFEVSTTNHFVVVHPRGVERLVCSVGIALSLVHSLHERARFQYPTPLGAAGGSRVSQSVGLLSLRGGQRLAASAGHTGTLRSADQSHLSVRRE